RLLRVGGVEALAARDSSVRHDCGRDAESRRENGDVLLDALRDVCRLAQGVELALDHALAELVELPSVGDDHVVPAGVRGEDVAALAGVPQGLEDAEHLRTLEALTDRLPV